MAEEKGLFRLLAELLFGDDEPARTAGARPGPVPAVGDEDARRWEQEMNRKVDEQGIPPKRPAHIVEAVPESALTARGTHHLVKNIDERREAATGSAREKAEAAQAAREKADAAREKAEAARWWRRGAARRQAEAAEQDARQAEEQHQAARQQAGVLNGQREAALMARAEVRAAEREDPEGTRQKIDARLASDTPKERWARGEQPRDEADRIEWARYDRQVSEDPVLDLHRQGAQAHQAAKDADEDPLTRWARGHEPRSDAERDQWARYDQAHQDGDPDTTGAASAEADTAADLYYQGEAPETPIDQAVAADLDQTAGEVWDSIYAEEETAEAGERGTAPARPEAALGSTAPHPAEGDARQADSTQRNETGTPTAGPDRQYVWDDELPVVGPQDRREPSEMDKLYDRLHDAAPETAHELESGMEQKVIHDLAQKGEHDPEIFGADGLIRHDRIQEALKAELREQVERLEAPDRGAERSDGAGRGDQTESGRAEPAQRWSEGRSPRTDAEKADYRGLDRLLEEGDPTITALYDSGQEAIREQPDKDAQAKGDGAPARERQDPAPGRQDGAAPAPPDKTTPETTAAPTPERQAAPAAPAPQPPATAAPERAAAPAPPTPAPAPAPPVVQPPPPSVTPPAPQRPAGPPAPEL